MEAPCRFLLLVVSLIAAPVACAGLALDDFGGSLGLTSDYINHGISQTCGDPAAQADVHYRSAGGRAASEAFAGAWGSMGLGQSACGKSREFNAYAGYSLVLGQDSSAALTYTHYGYPGGYYYLPGAAGRRYDYDALEGQWAWQDRVYLTLAWTPDAFSFEQYQAHRDRHALSYGLQLHQPVGAGFTLSAGVGYDQIFDISGAGYAFWNAGVGYGLGPVQLQVGYFGTARQAQRDFGNYVAGNRVSASIVWRFQ